MVNLGEVTLLAIFKDVGINDVEIVEGGDGVLIYSLTSKIFSIYVPALDVPYIGIIIPLERWIDKGEYRAKICNGATDLVIVEDWSLFEALLDIFARLVNIDVEKLRKLKQTAIAIYSAIIPAIWLIDIDRGDEEEVREEAINVMKFVTSLSNMLRRESLRRRRALERCIRLFRSLLDKSCRLLKDLSTYSTEIVIEAPSRISIISSVWLRHAEDSSEDRDLNIDLLCMSKDRYIISLGAHTDSIVDILAMLPLPTTYVEDIVDVDIEKLFTGVDIHDFPHIAKKHVNTCTRLVKVFGYRPFKAFNILRSALPHVEKNFKRIEISCEYVIDGTLSISVPSRFVLMCSPSLSDMFELSDCPESLETQICREVLEALSIRYSLVDKFSIYEALYDPAYRDYILVSEVGVIVPQSSAKRITIFPLLAEDHVEIDENRATIRTKDEFIKTSVEVGRRIGKMLEKEKITDVKVGVLSLEGYIFNPSHMIVQV